LIESIKYDSFRRVAPSTGDVEAMARALFAVIGGIQRTIRHSKPASALALLLTVGEQGRLRPSEIAERHQVHPSLITRQIRELEGQGYIIVEEDPSDRRAWVVSLTAEGIAESRRLYKVGLGRFALFLADWETSEVRALTALLEKFKDSAAAVAARARRPIHNRRRRST
jgi:DNA-binding MarR family transcriptional regulator